MANSNANQFEQGEHLCADSGATRFLATRLARSLQEPVVVALDGPLGAGKTEFVKGLALGLGCSEVPTSPTFAVAHEYSGGRMPLFHFDFYRLGSDAEVETSGFEECLGQGMVAVEWAEKFPEWLPVDALRVRLELLEDETRKVTLA